MKLIAFTGFAGAGKSTAAAGLIAAGWTRISFADTIRAMLIALGVTPEELAQKSTPLNWLGQITPRELMQTLGTEWGRDLVYSEIWVVAAQRRILRALADPATVGVVVDDCRFDNEAIMLRNLGGIIIEIERPGTSRMAHRSEAGISPDLVHSKIINNFASVAELLEELVKHVPQAPRLTPCISVAEAA